MTMHYINTGGVRGMAMGGILLDIDEVKVVGEYWPATKEDSAHFDVLLNDGQKVSATFDSSIPVDRQMEEHARLVKAIVKKFGLTGEGAPTGIGDGKQTIREIDFEPAEKTLYDATDPDGAWLLTGKALGAFVAYLYQMEDPDDLSDKHQAIKLAEQFAVKVFGDSMAMDEFAKARDRTVWKQTEDDPDRVYNKAFGKPI